MAIFEKHTQNEVWQQPQGNILFRVSSSSLSQLFQSCLLFPSSPCLCSLSVLLMQCGLGVKHSISRYQAVIAEGIKYLSRSSLLVLFFLHHVCRPILEHSERRRATAGQNAAFAIRSNCFCFCSVIYKLTLGKSFPASCSFYVPRVTTVVAISCGRHEY